MQTNAPLTTSQRIVQACLFLVSAIALFGGALQMSISQVGLPEPSAVWLGYLIPELFVPCVMIVAHRVTNKNAAAVKTRVA
jgi:hypothetical protein